jgi:nitrous oxidase accessory protein NosD
MQGINQLGYNEISNNDIIANREYAIRIHSPTNNTVHDNNIVDNNLSHYVGNSISISGGSKNNVFYHNNIIGDTSQLVYVEVAGNPNRWDYGSSGNFWSDYTGQDLNHNGIGDTS